VFGRKSADAAWIEACGEADRLDPGWRWEDLLARRTILPADCDAAQVTQEAAAQLPPGFKLRLERELDQIPRNESLSPKAAEALGDALSQTTIAHRLARQVPLFAVGRPADCGRPVIRHVPVHSIGCNRRVAVLLKLHAVMAAESNRIDEALANSRAMLSIADVAREPPMLVTALVSFAIRSLVVDSVERSLAQGEPSMSALEITQRTVENSQSAPVLLEGLRGERAINEEFIREFEQGRVSRWQLVKLELGDAIFHLNWRGFYGIIGAALLGSFDKGLVAEGVRYFTALIELLKDSPQHSELILPSVSPAVQRSFGSVGHVLGADRRQRANLAVLACALATERFRLSNGCWPRTISDLIPQFLSSVPVDPYDSQPLHYCRKSDRVIIDTIGLEQDSEERKIHEQGNDSPADIGIRLWNPEYRHRPAT
jgi:hypothetical protein